MNEPMLEKLFNKKTTDATLPAGLRVCAIGDIHGRADLLDELLSTISGDISSDFEGEQQVVFLGDYVDRGPDSRGVLDRLIACKNDQPSWIFLKGNHEAAMLDFLQDAHAHEEWLHWGGAETMESYGLKRVWARDAVDLAEALRDAMPAAHRKFLQSLDLTYQAGDYFFVHAGIKPGVALDDQDEGDLLWIRSAFHNMPAKLRPDEVIVHGHQPMKKPLDAGWRIAVDTGACWSGHLTAIVLEGASRRFISTG